MPKEYIVYVREIHLQPFLVVAESEADAAEQITNAVKNESSKDLAESFKILQTTFCHSKFEKPYVDDLVGRVVLITSKYDH